MLLIGSVLAALGAMAFLASWLAYPIWLWRQRGSFQRRDDTPQPPSVAICLAAHNPPDHALDSYRSLVSHYPVWVCDDASQNPIQADPEAMLRLHRQPTRQGKNAALNLLLQESDAEILVFTDVGTRFDAASVAKLVAPFDDGRVGVTVGQLRLEGASQEGRYWRYEHWLKQRESEAGELIVANGGFFAMRRGIVEAFSRGMNNDFEAPLAALAQGFQVILVNEAVALESHSDNPKQDFARKVRIVQRAMRVIRTYWRKLPSRIRWRVAGHKLARYTAGFWLLPWLIGLAMATLAGGLLSAVLLGLTFAGGVWAATAMVLRWRGLLGLPGYLVMMLAAGMLGLWRSVTRPPLDVWQPTVH